MSFNYGSKNADNDNGYEIIGTPFPSLEADEIVSRKPEIDQTVRDERGRRRFHGAFTGGFSAGYWNTVGSVEGFTPKIFKSSRKDKYDKTEFTSKPEDFMDEEDFGSFGIAPKKIHTKDDFVENFSISSLKDSKMTFDEVIRSVFQPSKESIGKRLYRKMKRAAKLEERQQQLIDHQISVDEKTEKINNNFLQSKTNRHGLGYSGMLNTDEVYNESSNLNNKSDKNAVMATLKSGKKLQISGEAFGYGALEEDDAIDIYATDDLSQYDFEIGTKVKKVTPKKTLVYNRNTSTIQLDGFVKCKENLNLFSNIKQKYQPPELPKGWKPKNQNSTTKPSNKKSRWDSKSQSPTDDHNQSSSQQLDQQPKQKILNSNLRAVILGENILHKTGVKKEIEFSKEIQKPTPPPLPPSQKLSVPIVPTLKTPLSGYFASKFTRSSTASTTIGDKPLAAGLNTFEAMSMISLEEQKKKNESNETIDSDSKQPIRTIYEWHPHKILCKRFGVQNPYPQFTDIVGIVCMNDNDKSRNMIARLSANPTKSNTKSSSLFANLFEDLNKTPLINPSNDNTISVEIKEQTTTNFVPKVQTIVDDNYDDEISVEEKPMPPKPPIDLFKSIFASDEEDEDDEETDNNNQVKDSNINNPKTSTDSKNYGIFSGIDFDQLKENFKPTTSSSNVNQVDKPNNLDDDDDDDDCYGPALPPTTPSLPNEAHASATSATNLYEKIKSSKHHHKKKKDKKSKRKKSKSSNHKKSKKRKRTSSSSSSESIDSPIKKNDNYNDIINKKHETDNEKRVKDKIDELIKKVKHNHNDHLIK